MFNDQTAGFIGRASILLLILVEDILWCIMIAGWIGRASILLLVLVEHVVDVAEDHNGYRPHEHSPLTDGAVPEEKFSAVRRVA